MIALPTLARPAVTAIAAVLLLAGCGEGGERAAVDTPPREQATGAPAAAGPAASPAATPTAAGAWDLVSSGEGTALVFPAQGTAAVRLFCPSLSGRILVNVPAFKPVASEERLSFGSGGAVEALVADTRGDRLRGGVSGTGPVPEGLPALLAGPVAVNYGAQNSGPHPAPPAGLVRGFLEACGERAAPAPPPPKMSACLVQDGKRLAVAPVRAIGTEPFWGAAVEGRCVTYSHPEDQPGTRVWTRYTAGAGGSATWTGALGGRPFVLTLRPQPGCSDGMSDRRYPLAAALTVNGEQRTGCAFPAP